MCNKQTKLYDYCPAVNENLRKHPLFLPVFAKNHRICTSVKEGVKSFLVMSHNVQLKNRAMYLLDNTG
jgi:hypothetical protein